VARALSACKRIVSAPGCVASRSSSSYGPPRLARTGRDEDREREALAALGQEDEPADRFGVGPLRVVDEQDERALVRQRGGQPVEAVHDPERVARLRRLEAERSGSQRGRAGQPWAHCVRLEQLAHDAVAVRLLQHRAARA
jgi:hypothetical protein